jgi:hypothetical protein
VTSTGAVWSASLEESEYREDPTMIVFGLRQVQLGEDATDVLLHGSLSNP